MSFSQPAMIDLLYGKRLIGAAKFETYEPGTLNCDGSFEPSPPNTFAFLPCSSSCWANVCASPGFCVGKNTTSASFGTFVTYAE